MQVEPNGGNSPVSDFTEDNFEEELAEPIEDDFCSTSYPAVGDAVPDKFSSIAKYGIVDVKGDDSNGRKLIVVYAFKLPPVKDIDHSLLLGYNKKLYAD